MEKVRELIVTQQAGGSQVMPYLGFPLRAPETWPPAEGGESWVEEWRGAERLLLATLVGKRREGKGSLKPAPWKRKLGAESQPPAGGLEERWRRDLDLFSNSMVSLGPCPGLRRAGSMQNAIMGNGDF